MKNQLQIKPTLRKNSEQHIKHHHRTHQVLDGFKAIDEIQSTQEAVTPGQDAFQKKSASGEGFQAIETEEGLRAKISKRNLFKSIDDIRIAFEEEKMFVREQLEVLKAQINSIVALPLGTQDETVQESTILEDLDSTQKSQINLLT